MEKYCPKEVNKNNFITLLKLYEHIAIFKFEQTWQTKEKNVRKIKKLVGWQPSSEIWHSCLSGVIKIFTICTKNSENSNWIFNSSGLTKNISHLTVCKIWWHGFAALHVELICLKICLT